MGLRPARVLGAPDGGLPSNSSLPGLDETLIDRRPAVRLRAARTRKGESALDVLGESVCPYCGVGCRLRFEGTGADVTRVRGVEAAPANRGGLCAKGAQLGPTINTADRLLRPQLRLGRNDAFRPVPWDTAFAYLRECF